MKEIKVYLQYPWAFPDSPYYKNLVGSPPENIVYINAEDEMNVLINRRRFVGALVSKCP
jgi:hypothetical protein